MSLDFELMKLIARGKNADARYDIVRIIDTDKCVTVAILDAHVELKDKAIRNFIEDLVRIQHVEVMKHKLPGGRWITLITRVGSTFIIADVIQKHLATRIPRKEYGAQEVRFIEDVPFDVYFNGPELHYVNKQLKIHVIWDWKSTMYGEPRKRAEKQVKQQLYHIRRKSPQLLQYLTKKEN